MAHGCVLHPSPWGQAGLGLEAGRGEEPELQQDQVLLVTQQTRRRVLLCWWGDLTGARALGLHLHTFRTDGTADGIFRETTVMAE